MGQRFATLPDWTLRDAPHEVDAEYGNGVRDGRRGWGGRSDEGGRRAYGVPSSAGTTEVTGAMSLMGITLHRVIEKGLLLADLREGRVSMAHKNGLPP